MIEVIAFEAFSFTIFIVADENHEKITGDHSFDCIAVTYPLLAVSTSKRHSR